MLYDEQIQDPGFEVCSWSHWSYLEAGNYANYDLSTTPLDKTLTAIVNDEKHSGDSSLRVVLQSGGGAIGVYPEQISPCVERSYVFSFWAKQAADAVCTVSFYWRGVSMGSITPPTNSWGKFEGRKDTSPVVAGDQSNNGLVELRVNCTSGGLESSVFLDDVSFQQVPYLS